MCEIYSLRGHRRLLLAVTALQFPALNVIAHSQTLVSLCGICLFTFAVECDGFINRAACLHDEDESRPFQLKYPERIDRHLRGVWTFSSSKKLHVLICGQD